jgi:hypothetical protein
MNLQDLLFQLFFLCQKALKITILTSHLITVGLPLFVLLAFILGFFWWNWGLKSRLHDFKARTLLLEPPPVHFALVSFGDGASPIICPGLS